MPTFFYKATNASGKLQSGQLEVPGKRQALERLERMGLFPLLVTDQQSRKKETRSRTFKLDDFLPSKRVGGKQVLDFTDKMATLLKAGLPLAKALTLVIDTTSHVMMQEVVKQVLKDVKAGNSLAESLAKHPRVFERLYVNMVRTGEAAGVLEQVLDNIRKFLETRENLKSFLISSMVYPSILGFTGFGTVLVLVFFVLPRFQEIFEQVGQELPFITRLMVDTTTFIATYKWFILATVIISIVAFRRWKSSEDGRMKWDTWLLKAPLIGTIVTQIEVNRFSNTLGILLRSSVTLLDAMSIAREIAENRVFQKAMEPIVKGIKKGEGMSISMVQAGVFPKIAVQLVMVGEETGTLGEMFTKIANIYQADLEKTMKRLISLFEPVMIFVMFLVVGFIVSAMLLAVTSLSTSSI